MSKQEAVQQQTAVPQSDDQAATKRTPAEWTTFAIVLLILAGLIGSLLWYALQPADEMTSFEVQVEQAAIEERAGRFYVPMRVRNAGAATAEDVIVLVELTRGEETVEEAELTFRFVSGGEEADGVAVFVEDPRDGTLEAGVTSYLIP
jgi:uncharacterized protein (TIGR02588 family)